MNALQRYDEVAGHYGWLPIGLSDLGHPCVLTLREAAARCRGLYPELAVELDGMAEAEVGIGDNS